MSTNELDNPTQLEAWALDAGFCLTKDYHWHTRIIKQDGWVTDELTRFAFLVRSAAIEECAKACEQLYAGRARPLFGDSEEITGDDYAAAVRSLKTLP